MSPEVVEWTRELGGTIEALEGFWAEFEQWMRCHCAGLDAFTTELVVREAVANAVVHGCGSQPGQRVRCRARARGGHLVLSVQDSGRGFDWKSRWDHRAEPGDEHGRGMEILRRFTNKVRFNRSGNGLTLVKRF